MNINRCNKTKTLKNFRQLDDLNLKVLSSVKKQL